MPITLSDAMRLVQSPAFTEKVQLALTIVGTKKLKTKPPASPSAADEATAAESHAHAKRILQGDTNVKTVSRMVLTDSRISVLEGEEAITDALLEAVVRDVVGDILSL